MTKSRRSTTFLLNFSLRHIRNVFIIYRKIEDKMIARWIQYIDGYVDERIDRWIDRWIDWRIHRYIDG